MSFSVVALFSGNSTGEGDAGLHAAFSQEGRGVDVNHSKRPDQRFSFTFDHAMRGDERGNNVGAVYSACAEPAVSGALVGQVGVVFVYGHAGSGKTSTLLGSGEGKGSPITSPSGVLQKSCFALMSSGSPKKLWVSVVEVYREAAKDLLRQNGAALRLRDSGSTTTVEGASEQHVASPSDLQALIEAVRPSVVGSKGHVVFTVRVGGGGRLFFVRLADTDLGSTAKGAPPEQVEARKWANKSFAALGGCLKAVSDKSRLVPVRDSTLTRMLREGLRESGHVSLVGLASVGDDRSADESIATLRFAHRIVRAEKIKGASGAGAHQQQQQAGESGVGGTGVSGNNIRSGGRADAGGVSHGDKRPPLQFPPRESTVGVAGAGAGAGAGGFSGAQDELVKAWGYAFAMENLVAWMVEVFQVGGYDPSKLEAMLLNCCEQLVGSEGGGSSPADAVKRILSMHGEDDLELPGGGGQMNNFRRNPMVDSPWAGGMHRVLIEHGILRKLQSPEIATLLAPVHSSHALGASSGSTPGNSGATSPERAVKGDVLGQGGAGKAGVGGEQGTPGKFEVQVPRVVTEDAKFLHLDGRINELESKAAGGGGEELDAFDVHIESLRKDVEASLDHIDDELFANLVSRVSYLKMRREWERESGGRRASAPPPPATPGGKGVAVRMPSAQDERATALLQELQALKSRPKSSASARASTVLPEEDATSTSSALRSKKPPLAPSNPTPGEGASAEFSTASKEEESASRLLDLLRVSLKTHERRHQSKVYAKCFNGWQLVDWLVDKIDADSLPCVTKVWNCSIPALAEGGDISREEASIIAQGLMNAQVFVHLGSAADFSDDDTLYRLLEGEELTVVLNRQVLWSSNSRPAVEVSQSLLRMAISLAYSSGARDFGAVQEFQRMACELQMVNLIQLPVEELRCFFINIFNVLVLHSKVTSKAPVDDDHVVPRCSFFRNTSYQVGKYFYSLDDICRGVLRAKKCLFLDCDPRVHFALSYGTRHTPQARVFGAHSLDLELDSAARNFCTDRVKVDAEGGVVTLPLLCEWYRKDFEASGKTVIEWVSAFVPPNVAAGIAAASARKDLRVVYE